MIKDRIASLDDQTAIGILTTIARSLMRSENYETAGTPEMADALKSVFSVSDPSENASEGDTARAALQLLATDPQYAQRISVMANGPDSKQFAIDAGSVAVAAAAIVLLQTHVRFERDKKGKVSVLIEKKSASDSLLKALVEKLLGIWKLKK